MTNSIEYERLVFQNESRPSKLIFPVHDDADNAVAESGNALEEVQSERTLEHSSFNADASVQSSNKPIEALMSCVNGKIRRCTPALSVITNSNENSCPANQVARTVAAIPTPADSAPATLKRKSVYSGTETEDDTRDDHQFNSMPDEPCPPPPPPTAFPKSEDFMARLFELIGEPPDTYDVIIKNDKGLRQLTPDADEPDILQLIRNVSFEPMRTAESVRKTPFYHHKTASFSKEAHKKDQQGESSRRPFPDLCRDEHYRSRIVLQRWRDGLETDQRCLDELHLYSMSHVQTLLERELRFQTPLLWEGGDLIHGHDSVTRQMRCEKIDEIRSLVHDLGEFRRTFFLAVEIFDTFLSVTRNLAAEIVAALPVTCVILSLKIEPVGSSHEDLYKKVWNASRHPEQVDLQIRDILGLMERLVMRANNYKVDRPLPIDYLHFFLVLATRKISDESACTTQNLFDAEDRYQTQLKALNLTEAHTTILSNHGDHVSLLEFALTFKIQPRIIREAIFWLDLLLHDVALLRYPPSTIAAIAVYKTLMANKDENVDCDMLENLCGISTETLQNSAKYLENLSSCLCVYAIGERSPYDLNTYKLQSYQDICYDDNLRHIRVLDSTLSPKKSQTQRIDFSDSQASRHTSDLYALDGCREDELPVTLMAPLSPKTSITAEVQCRKKNDLCSISPAQSISSCSSGRYCSSSIPYGHDELLQRSDSSGDHADISNAEESLRIPASGRSICDTFRDKFLFQSQQARTLDDASSVDINTTEWLRTSRIDERGSPTNEFFADCSDSTSAREHLTDSEPLDTF